MLQHLTHFAGLQVSEARKDQLVPLLMPRAIKGDGVEVGVEPQVG
jgi:hypothetical protein